MIGGLFILVLFVVLLVYADDLAGWLVWQFAGDHRARPRGFLTKLVMRRRTLSITASAISELATITRLNIPLGPALRAASKGERGRMKRVLADLGRWMDEGAWMSVALSQSVPGCPAFVETVVAAGEDTGQLPRALATLETMLRDRLRAGRGLARGYALYPVLLLLVFLATVTLVMVKVIPKFDEIFTDFDVALPASTQHLAWFARALGEGAVVFCMAYPVILISFVIVLIVFAWPRAAGRVRPTTWIADNIRWCVPIVHDIERAWGTAASVEVMEMGVAAGMPLDAAAHLAARIDVNMHVRRRFKWLGTLLAQGEPPASAARQASLDPVVTSAIASVVRGCDPKVAFGHAAQYHRAMAYRWWHALAQFVWPAVTVACACAVAFIALALVEPLVALINSSIDATGLI